MMKKILVFSLLLVGCIITTSFDYKLSRKKEILPNDSIIVNSLQQLLFKTDDKLYTQTMNLRHLKLSKIAIEKVDSVDATSYISNIYIFEANKNESNIIFWETQYENIPITYAYYLCQNKLIKIGEFEVTKRYKNETYEFPANEIDIKQVNNVINFSFRKDIYYRVSKVDEKIIKANKIIYIFDVKTGKIMHKMLR